LTEDDVASQGSGLEVEPEDFDDPMDVIPVSDPQIFSETQRFAQVQAIMQRAALIPQMYDARKVEEMFLRAMKVSDDLLQPKLGEDDVDPVSENVAAAMGRPIYVLPKQEHLAHLKLHLTFLQSPLFGQNPAIIKTFLWPMAQHLRDHLLNYYLTEAHRGAKLASDNQVIQEDADAQAGVVAQVQQLIEQQLGGFGQALAQIDQQAQQFKPQPPMPPDNSMQVAQLNAQVQGQIAQQRAQLDQAKLQATQQLEGQKLQLAQQKEQTAIQAQAEQQRNQMLLEQFKQQQENQRRALEVNSRERMNTSDNETAMHIAAAEIRSGENVGVSTGTGINP